MKLQACIFSSQKFWTQAWYSKGLPPFIVDFPSTAKLTFFGWHVVVVYLLVTIILAQIVYHNNRNNLYRYYQFYAVLLLVFILSRNSYFRSYYQYFGNQFVYTIGYLIQICYLCVYFRFGTLFLKLDKHVPVFHRRIFAYTATVFIASILLFGLIFTGIVPHIAGENFFYFIFLPVHITLAGIIIAKSLKTPERHKRYFLWGSFFYIAFALISTFALFYRFPFEWFGIQPIVYFYIAIVAECTLFAIGLGMQIKDNLQEKYELQALFRQTEREMEIKILRGQLNSHFIFNVLNSIKAFIIEKEVDEATDYLEKFSKFIRGILEGSNQETSTLREELDTLLLYADIENMRLSNAITITKEVEEGIDIDAYHLPAMVLQPFVENAIWHGLNNSKKPEKSIRLKVAKQQNGLNIFIEDNGLGYSNTRAAETKVFAKSYGLRIVREQLQRFNAKRKQKIDFTISDKDGGGTQVVFTIIDNPQ